MQALPSLGLGGSPFLQWSPFARWGSESLDAAPLTGEVLECLLGKRIAGELGTLHSMV